jgi:hypothetical protein
MAVIPVPAIGGAAVRTLQATLAHDCLQVQIVWPRVLATLFVIPLATSPYLQTVLLIVSIGIAWFVCGPRRLAFCNCGERRNPCFSFSFLSLRPTPYIDPHVNFGVASVVVQRRVLVVVLWQNHFVR